MHVLAKGVANRIDAIAAEPDIPPGDDLNLVGDQIPGIASETIPNNFFESLYRAHMRVLESKY